MTTTTDTTSDGGAAGGDSGASAPVLRLPARLLGVLFTPRATYAGVAARPRAFGVLATIVLIGAVGTFIFLSTDVGRNAMIDQQIETMKSFGMQMNDAQVARMEQGAERGKYIGPI